MSEKHREKNAEKSKSSAIFNMEVKNHVDNILSDVKRMSVLQSDYTYLLNSENMVRIHKDFGIPEISYPSNLVIQAVTKRQAETTLRIAPPGNTNLFREVIEETIKELLFVAA